MTQRSEVAASLDSTDELAIRRLYEGYNDFIDRGDAESWAMVWCEDGVFEHPARTYKGREELASFVRQRAAGAAAQPVTGLRHWNSDIRLSSEGDRVVGECALLVSARDRESGSPSVMTTGMYSDVVAWDGHRWRFVRRTLRVE
ncbi:hypothetical protein GCM10009712_37400 [Pseudarthrobacter sulfonivorans]|uniref:nuclear transport factor 2 family protein n=1 Tax=Pseudarthrobacter sulfonivorans TaxID=121292 RepID=UPI00168A91A4|nr:nuclear transport factor 2 family protein [Pseudarthrobacter sulfonivorans]